jgi:hypothetical protein
VAKSHLPMLIEGWISDGHGSCPGLEVGQFSGTGCVVSQPLGARGNRSYPKFWAITGSPRYPGYLPS